jgi:NADH:ubiquinone reductase (non-electrogenic)
MRVEEDGYVGFGIAVWCAGNKACGLVEGLEVRKSEGAMERVLTDQWLRVLKPEREKGEEHIEGLYALGDAADIGGHSLPCTAEITVQKAKWLAKRLTEIDEGKGRREKWHLEKASSTNRRH